MHRTTHVLRTLGVPFKTRTRHSFLETNEADLEYIYNDFHKASRQALAKLHPDAGGDPAEFRALHDATCMVRRFFERAGVIKSRTSFVPAQTKQLHNRDAKKYYYSFNLSHPHTKYIYQALKRLMMRDGCWLGQA